MVEDTITQIEMMCLGVAEEVVGKSQTKYSLFLMEIIL